MPRRKPADELPPEGRSTTLRFVTVVLNVDDDTLEIYYPDCSAYEAMGLLKAAAVDQEAFVLGEPDE